MQRMFNLLDGLYLHGKILLIDTIIENKSRKQSAAEVEILNRKNNRNKKRKVYISLLQQRAVLLIKQPEQVEQQVPPTIQILMWAYHNGLKHAVVNRKILSVAEKVMLKL